MAELIGPAPKVEMPKFATPWRVEDDAPLSTFVVTAADGQRIAEIRPRIATSGAEDEQLAQAIVDAVNEKFGPTAVKGVTLRDGAMRPLKAGEEPLPEDFIEMKVPGSEMNFGR